MTTAYSTNLGLALPVQGELSGTWGDTVNNGITDYLDIAIAGTQTISGNQTAVTLSLTNGDSSATNIAQVGSGSTGTAQYAIINCTGNPAGLLTITVPASSRQYIVINATSTNQSVKVVGAGPTTGVTMVAGEKAIIAWNGSDFVKVAFTSITVTDGTYTPTITNVAFVDIPGSTPYAFQFLRVGSTVTVSGRVNIKLLSGGDICRMTISLPVASTFTDSGQCAGFGEALAGGLLPPPTLRGTVIADGTNALFRWYSNTTGAAQTYYFHFTYRIV